MKQMKKLTAILMAVLMLAAMSTTALADYKVTDGTITISNATDGATYTAYKILDMEVNSATGAYRYKTNSAWVSFISNQSTYFTVTTDGYVTATTAYTDTAAAATVAEAAEQFVKSNSISATASTTANSGTVTIAGLACGYYLVTSTSGTLCALNSLLPDNNAAPTASFEEKNELPSITKKVDGDDTTTASIGDALTYTITVVAESGAENYKIVDTLPAGVDVPNADKISVTYSGTDITSSLNGNITVTKTATGQEITVDLTSYLASSTINAKDEFVITYFAYLNASAVVGGNGNVNTAVLTYGHAQSPSSKNASATVYTYSFDLVKTDDKNTVIDGAKFKLYESDKTTEIEVVADGNNYRVATASEKSSNSTVDAITAGNVTISGLASGTYYVEETKAPDGYIKADGKTAVEIKDANNNATMNGNTYTSGGVQVKNMTGTPLPSTGGIGTTVFYVLGVSLMVGAGGILLARKRRDAES